VAESGVKSRQRRVCSTDADFLNKMRLALREAKESHACLIKIRRAPLAHADAVIELGLEDEADQLCAIFSTIITNMSHRSGGNGRNRGRS
jgi:hypothetical protein